METGRNLASILQLYIRYVHHDIHVVYSYKIILIITQVSLSNIVIEVRYVDTVSKSTNAMA